MSSLIERAGKALNEEHLRLFPGSRYAKDDREALARAVLAVVSYDLDGAEEGDFEQTLANYRAIRRALKAEGSQP